MFVKVNKTKAEVNEREGAYNKLDEELKKLKTQLDKANQAKQLFNDFFSDIRNPRPI